MDSRTVQSPASTSSASSSINVLDLSEEVNDMKKSDVVLALAAQLEPLPATLSRLASLDSNACDLADVASAIRLDPVLTLQLLKTANSAFSASGTEVSTVDEAVMRLGIGLIISMSFALSVGKTMSSSVPAYGLAAGDLWRHSAAAAVSAEILSRMAPRTVPPATITAALLHDTGKLLLARGTTCDELEFVSRARIEAGLTLEEAEMEIMAMSHPEISYIVTQHWGLPERMCRAIMYHADPDQWDDTMCDAVHVADLAARAIEAVERGEPVEIPALRVIQRLGLVAFDFKEFCAKCAERFSQLRSLYGA